MLQDNELSRRFVTRRRDNFPVPCRLDWRASRSSIVNASMGHFPLMNRMHSIEIESGTHMRKVHWISDKCFSETNAISIEVADLATRICVAIGLVLLTHV